MRISANEVKQAARLARLEVLDNEVETITEQLDRILGYIDKLNELNTEGVSPTTHAVEMENAFRADETLPSLSQQEALANGPKQNGEAFVVPRVI